MVALNTLGVLRMLERQFSKKDESEYAMMNALKDLTGKAWIRRCVMIMVGRLTITFQGALGEHIFSL